MVITKDSFVEQMRNKYNYTKVSAQTALNDVLDLIISNVENGDSVSFMGFGQFVVKDRPAREIYNPVAGEKQMVPDSRHVKFNPGKHMKEAAIKSMEIK